MKFSKVSKSGFRNQNRGFDWDLYLISIFEIKNELYFQNSENPTKSGVTHQFELSTNQHLLNTCKQTYHTPLFSLSRVLRTYL